MSSENMQLSDDGAIIGYKPELGLSKNIKAVVDASDNSIASNKENYTTTLQSFLENMPAEAIGYLEEIIDNIGSTIDQLKSIFKESYSGTYSNIEMFLESLVLENTDYAAKFLEYHMDNIKGSSIPELCVILTNEQDRLKALAKTLKKLYYGGENVSDEYMQNQDSFYKKTLTGYEVSSPEKINYIALTCDAILNRSVNTFAADVNAEIINLLNVAYIEDTTVKTSNTDAINLITSMFDEQNQQLKDRNSLYNTQQSIDTMIKTLYNYYDKRKNLLNYYSLAVSSGDESGFLMTKIQNYDDNII